MTNHNNNPTGDALTVLPGQPVTYHQVAPAPAGSPPPGPSTPRLTYAEAQLLEGALGAALLPAPFGFEPEVSRKVTSKEYAHLIAAIARVTIQPTECTHEALEWPMSRCPTCGTEGR